LRSGADRALACGMEPRGIVFGLLLAAGCARGEVNGTSGTGGTTGGNGTCDIPATVTQDGFVAAFTKAFCCSGIGCDPFVPSALALCQSGALSLRQVVDLAMALDAGTLAVDAAHAAACLQALVGQRCSGQTEFPLECRPALVGKQSIGGPCFTPIDCAEGLCAGWSYDCPGVCTVEDGGCETVNDCAEWETCSGGHCGPGAAVGKGCSQDVDCALGSFCNGGSCAAPGPAGTACASDEECVPGTFCLAAPGHGTCTAQAEPGQACLNLNSPHACVFGSYCLGTGVCVAYGDVGSSCQPPTGDNIVWSCLLGLYCRSDGICEPLPQSGPCLELEQGQCALGYYCDAAMLCGPLRSNGMACDMDGSGCASQVCSDAGTCVAPDTACR
jgi:hypothetical protein